MPKIITTIKKLFTVPEAETLLSC